MFHQHFPKLSPAAGRYRHGAICTALLLVLTFPLLGAHRAAAATATSVGNAAAAPVRQAGTVSGTPHAVNLRSLSAAAKNATATSQLSAAQRAALQIVQQHTGVPLPTRPSTGSRPSAPGTRHAATGANGPTPSRVGAAPHANVVPFAAPAVAANFDGVAKNNGGCSEFCGPGSSAAVGANEIVQMVNTKFVVFQKDGFEECENSLNGFLNTIDRLDDPRVQYDVATGRYSFAVGAFPFDGSIEQPILWLGATAGSDPCGTWYIYRLDFTGLQPDAFVSSPMIGVDQNALLFSLRSFDASGEESPFVFGIPKTEVYSDGAVSGSIFDTAAHAAPVSSGGNPMVVSTGFSYFLNSIPGTGYALYRLTSGGAPGATLTLQATINAPFDAPTRGVNEPGQNGITLSPGYGAIDTPPVNDGDNIWFTHDIDYGGFPTVLYGAISIASNSATVAIAYHSSTSDDFNPSIGVGNSPTGGNYIFVNWAYTDAPNGVSVSDTVDSVAPNAGVPDLIGTGVVLVNGSNTYQPSFDDYSSVSIDLSVAAGSCAVTTQHYFAPDTTWITRIARVGSC